ncbi:Protein MEMO1 [Picochlorum sp. SENEW3]|nr:Protein MEMO1 [Picochlorum sp. SENEW3]
MPRTKRQRSASHSGSWYSNKGDELRRQIQSWMNALSSDEGGRVKAIIAPHAGYAYSGPTMAYAYKHIKPETIKRIFLLGPSHHVFSRACLLSSCTEYSTPLGSIPIDEDVYRELKETGAFQFIGVDDDEDEHSLEMHLPYIAEIMSGREYTLIPIIVGAVAPDSEALYGRLLHTYLESDDSLFVISSDFCHWGSRFGYQFRRPEEEIHASIAWLDSEGMKAIETKRPEEFYTYLKQYENTICGRHPIGILLQAISHSNKEYSIQFTRYDRSNLVHSMSDSSVSYASAIITMM